MNETVTKHADGSVVVRQSLTEQEHANRRASAVKRACEDIHRAIKIIESHGGPKPWSAQFPDWYSDVVSSLKVTDGGG